MLAQRVKPPAEATGPKQDQYVKLLLVCLHICNVDVPCWRLERCCLVRGIPSFFVHALTEAVLSCMLFFLWLTEWSHVRRLCTR